MRTFLKWVVPGIAVLCTALSAFSQDIIDPTATAKIFSQEGEYLA